MGSREAFDCDTCAHKNCDDSNPAPFDRWEVKGLITSNICLLPMVTNTSWTLLSWHKHYKNGVLLKGGGLLEQPNYYLEMMNILEYNNSDANNSNNKS